MRFCSLRPFVVLLFAGLTLGQISLMAQAPTVGQWTTLPYTVPINPVHAALLANGKVLIVAGSGNCPPTQSGCPSGPPYGPSNKSGAALWDPSTGNITQFTVSWDMFCNAMVHLADGRVLIVGGTTQYDPFVGASNTSIFDPATNTFTNVQSLVQERWYPTATGLGDGRVMAFAGQESSVEIYQLSTGWNQVATPPWTPPLYPRMTLLPSGKVFYSGSTTSSALYDPSNDSWTSNVANTIYPNQRTYGTSILLPLTPVNNYDPEIMIMGGDSPATATTEIIDMGASSPKWVSGPNMSQPRIEMNAVLLPTGKILAVGGSMWDEDTSSLSLNADMFDVSAVNLNSSPPNVGTMSSAGANATERLYHSVALLLPDATVWLAGGNPVRGTYNNTMEIYKPAYLFNSDGSLATRPSITSAPSSITYGNQFTVQTPDAANISSVVLMRNGAVTHAFDMDQRMVGLSFTPGSGSLTITAPPNSNIAPPGYYMLFLINSSGVPSLASFVRVSCECISFVQGNSGANSAQSGTSSLQVAYPGAQVAGDLNVVAVGWGDTTSSISSVTDSKGNTYSLAVGPTSNTGIQQSVYYARNVAGGSNTVTVTFSQAALYPDVRIVEYAGADRSNPLDVKVAAKGSGTTANSGSATTTTANELIFGAGTTGSSFNAPGSGFLSRMIDAFGNIAEDKTVTTIGTYNATATTNSSSPWVMQLASFRAGGQGASPPTVSAILPTSGTTTGGTSVTITGTGFLAGASVSFGSSSATNVNITSSTSVTATTPAAVASTVNVVITNTDGQSGTLTAGYTYVSPNPAPTVTAISPVSGSTSGGTAITVYGTGFLSGATLTLGTAATNVNIINSTSLTATTAAHTAGVTNVTVTNTDGQSGTLSNAYTYTNPAPTVSTISPSSGTTGGGTPITITGTGFLVGASVTFGGSSATNISIVSATSITAVTPAHAAGPINVVVTNTDSQSGTLANGYSYVLYPPPRMTAVSPVSGPTGGGTSVSITGTGFLAGASVTFGGTIATNLRVISSSSITATTPPHVSGAVNVVITNTDAQSGSLSGGFTYNAASISFVQVSSGPTSGQASKSSVSVAYPHAQTAGNLNVIAIGWGDNTSAITSVSDTRGNVYSLAVGPTSNTGIQQAIYYAKNIAGGANTVTVQFNRKASSPDVRILEYSGLNTSSPLDGRAAASGSGTVANSGSVTTTSGYELIFGAGTTGGAFSAAGAGFVSRVIDFYGNIAEDRTVTNTGSYNATGTTSSAVWVMQMATFRQ